MRAGFVGTGGFAREHAKAVTKLGHSASACYSTNALKSAEFAKDYGAKVFSNPLEMISRKNIDVLYLAVPPFAHDGSVELACVREKVPMLVEKPIGLDAVLCRKIAAEVEKAGLVTSVGYMLREMPLNAEVRRVLQRNRITSVRSCRMSGFPKVHWWRKLATSGGPMVEQTTHHVDLIRYLLGEVTQVAAFASYGIGSQRVEGADVCDSMETVMTFASGAIGSVGLCDTFDNGFRKVELLEVFGRDFYLSYGPQKLRYQEGKNEFVELAAPSDVDLILEENRRFLSAVEKNDGSAVLSTYADGLATLELTLAMNESAATGKVVKIG